MTWRDVTAFTKTDRVLHVIIVIFWCLMVVFYLLGDHAAALVFLFIAAGVVIVNALRLIVRWRRPRPLGLR